MKKFGIRFLAVLFLFLFTAPVFGQDTGGVVNETDILFYFASIPALASAVVILTQLFKKMFTITGSAAQYISWALSAVLAVIGMIFEWGIFAHIVWWVGLIYALAAGLIANGLFDWSIVRAVLQALKLYDGDEAPLKTSF